MVKTSQLQPVFATKCGTPCHYPASGGNPPGAGDGYGNYTSAALTQTIVGQKSQYAVPFDGGTLKVVDSTHLANSTLWLKVSAVSVVGRRGPNMELTGAAMPQTGDKLTAEELQQVKDWICTGANP
jgi:hypothetical protein